MKLRRINGRLLPQAGIFFKIPAFILCFLLLSQLARASDLYWVGGSGNWSDINHWSLSSGNSGGKLAVSIPQSGDNVTFDSKSGFTSANRTVTINQESSCNNFNITGISVPITFEGTLLSIYGNADYGTGTVLNHILYFKGTDSNSINFNAGVYSNSAMYFKGSGSWLIKGTLNSTGRIYFLQGSLNFGSSTITTGFFDEDGCCGSVPSPPIEPRTLNLGSSMITLTGRNSQSNNQSPSWSYSGTHLIAGTSQITISKSADDGYGVSFIGKNGHRYHNVSFTSRADPANTSPYGWYQIANGNCIFNSLSFASSGFIASNCTMDTLKLAKSKTCFLNGIQKIDAIENQTQDCQPLWNLSGYGGTQAAINSSASLKLKNVKISSIKIAGTGPFTAENSIDNGNNSGWQFMAVPKTLYWIGGGGNWNDPAHWTTHTDGSPSGGCLPTRNDDVFFNQYSGAISNSVPVMVSSADAECHHIHWNEVQGIPVFKTTTTTGALSIYGSSEWQNGMLYQIANTHYQGIEAGNTLTSNGVIIEGNTHFSSQGGWLLQDEFSSPLHTVNFSNGHLNTNGQTLTLKDFGPVGRGMGPRTLTLGNSMVNILGNWAYISYGGPEIILHAGSSQLNLSGSTPYFYYNSGLDYHHLAFTNPSGTASLYSTLYSTATACTFTALLFGGNASLNAGGNPTPITTAQLHFSASKKYVLGTNMEIKTGGLHMEGQDCKGLLEISSYIMGTRAKLNLADPAVITNAKLTDINAIGAALTVNGGLDGGNNLNVSITPISSRSLYWMGGTGNWSDPSHWTTNANGLANPFNSCPPGPTDHVFFNQFSGTHYCVNLDIPAHCNNMTWEETADTKPILKGLLANPLYIYGSLVLQTAMDYDVERTNFVGQRAGNSITTHGVVMDYTAPNFSGKGVFFNNSSGTWHLSDAFNVKNFGVVNGTFETNGQTVNAENYCSEYAVGTPAPTLNLGSSVINIAGYWDGGRIAVLNAGTSTINMNGIMSATNSSGGGVNNNEFGSKPGLIYYNLNFTNNDVAGHINGYDAQTGNTFNNVTFAGESGINGSNQFNILTLGPNKNSHLMAGAIQTVNRLVSTSSCGNWDFDNNCMSNSNACNTTQKAVIKSLSDISINNVKVSGISITGGASYGVKGTDMGNNSGWAFSLPAAKNLYWIGGNGNWNDIAHWTTNADGSASGGCLPTRFDNVFFNQYSGKSFMINITGVAEFHDMTWNGVAGTPAIGGTLSCYGSMTLQSSLSHLGGINFLSSETGSTIKTNGAVAATQFDIEFSGKGRYLLLDDFTTNTRINVTGGTLNTNGKTIRALSFSGAETNGQPVSLILGASPIYLTYGGEGWSYTGSGLEAGTSHIYLTESANFFKGKEGAVYHAITFDAGDSHSSSLYGGISVDTLIFSPRNSMYQIEAGKIVTVKRLLQMSGTNCSTVRLQSTEAGKQAGLCINGGSTIYNFISVKDINAPCTALILLPQSTNEGNNNHITFQPGTGSGIGILGQDIITCAAGMPLVLDGSAFMPAENTVIQWSNRTTGEILGTGIRQSVTTAGTYQITVIYGPNCIVTDEIIVAIDPVPAISGHITIVQPTCSETTGSISFKAAEGIAYSVDGGDYTSVLYYTLASGRHSITAKNLSGCISDTVFVTIHPKPLPPTASISYGSSEFQATGIVKVVQTGQTGGTYSASPSGLAIDAGTGTINLSNSLPNQSYTITYSFTNGDCSGSTTVGIKIKSSPATIAYGLQDYCAIGTVNVTQTGTKNGRYSASPSGMKIDELTGTIFLSESKAGYYSITYTYKDGPITATVSTNIKINALPILAIVSDMGTNISKGQTVILTASGGTAYSWIGADIQNGHNTGVVKVRPKETTTYTVIAVNADGCSNTAQFTIHVKEDHLLIPNTVITPNGDGKNDTWIIKNIDYYPDNRVKIYDRAGRLVYSKTGYANEWGGTLNGKLLNEDAYIYVIDFGNGTGLLRGTVSIIRNRQ